MDIGNSINRLAGSRDEGKKELSRVVEKGRDFEWMQGDTMSPKNIPQFLSPKSHQQTKNNSLVVFSGFQLLSTLHQLSMSPWPWWPPLPAGLCGPGPTRPAGGPFATPLPMLVGFAMHSLEITHSRDHNQPWTQDILLYSYQRE